MGILEDTKCIATPGYTGFIPSMMDSYGQTYGSITRKIMENDPCIIRNINAKKERDIEKKIYDAKIKEIESDLPWERKSDDDECTVELPPIPGYQGFITLSKDHFAKPYVENTKDAIAEFNYIQKNRTNTEAVKNIINSVSPVPVDPTKVRKVNKCINTKHDPQLLENTSVYKLPTGHPQKCFIAGYTGFVPHIQNYFGEIYSKNTRKAIEQFQQPIPEYDPYTLIRPKEKKINLITKNPIPGYTGFIPGAKRVIQQTYGNVTNSTIERINRHKLKMLYEDNY